MRREPRERRRPRPYRWQFSASGVIEYYDFNYWKVSKPPDMDHNTMVIDFRSWLEKERPDISAALFPTSLNL